MSANREAWMQQIRDEIALEREACAEVCDEVARDEKYREDVRLGAQLCAAAIRARGEQ